MEPQGALPGGGQLWLCGAPPAGQHRGGCQVPDCAQQARFNQNRVGQVRAFNCCCHVWNVRDWLAVLAWLPPAWQQSGGGHTVRSAQQA
jgi:hypothetical protein